MKRKKLYLGCIVLLIFLVILGIVLMQNRKKIESTDVVTYKVKEEEYTSMIFKLTDDYYYVKKYNDLYILDKNYNVIATSFFGVGGEYDVVVGKDNKIYVLERFIYYLDDIPNKGTMSIYEFEDNTFKKISEYEVLELEEYPFNNLYYLNYDGSKNEFLGIIKNSDKKEVCLIDSDCYEVEKELIGDSARIMEELDYITYNDKFIIVKENEKYSILNLEDGTIAFDFIYDELYSTYDGNYVAIKNGKAGIIDENNNVKIDFIYDFIDRGEDIYTVAKNGMMALMDLDYNLITDFDFKYQNSDNDYVYNTCCSVRNTIRTVTLDDKYVLITNNDTRLSDYENNNIYVIDKDGLYRTIEDVWYFEVVEKDKLYYTINASNHDKFTFYDYNLNKIYELEGNIIWINDNVISLDNDYYDIYTGKKIDYKSNKEYTFENITLSYDDKEISIYVDGELYKTISNYHINYHEDGKFDIREYDKNFIYYFLEEN